MRQILLAPLVGADSDYVAHFRDLSVLNLEIRRNGATPERLLRKAVLELDVGNYLASRDAAQDAVALAPFSTETHHQLGMAYVHLALAKAGVLPNGPGQRDGLPESVTGLLWRALEEWHVVLERAPGDEETAADAAVLETLLKSHPDDGSLTKALASLSN